MKPWIKNLLALAVIAGVALTWIGMARDGKANASPGTTAAACPSVLATAQQVMAGAPDPHSSFYNQTLYQMDARQVATLVVQNPQCYDTQTVTSATKALAGINH